MSHEDFDRHQKLEVGSNRGFGLTVGGVLIAIGAIRGFLSEELASLEIGLLSAGGALVVLAVIAEGVLSPLNKAWMKLGLLLSKIVTPVVMGLIFYTTVTPIGLIMRLLRKDLLRIKRDPETDTYWIQRDPPGPEPESIRRQF